MGTLPAETIDLLSKESAEAALLKPYLEIIRECIKSGWDAWKSLGSRVTELHAPLSKRTRASFVYDYIVYQIKSRFHKHPKVGLVEKRGFLTLEIDGGIDARAVLRIKKLDVKNRARNYPTTQQVLFSLQLNLPGWPKDASRLIAGYKLDLTETEIQEYLVTLPLGSNVEWFFEITEGERKVTEMPARNPDQLETEVRPRSAEKTKREDEK
jgi:hypothetical protein